MYKKKTRAKKYQYNVNKRKLWKKRTKPPTIEMKEIKENWNRYQSVKQNFKSFGLAVDSNDTFCPTKKFDIPQEINIKEFKSEMVGKLESLVETNAPKNSGIINNLSSDIIGYCEYMTLNYGDDYQAMSKDPTNFFQETPKQIKRKIFKYKSFINQKSISILKNE